MSLPAAIITGVGAIMIAVLIALFVIKVAQGQDAGPISEPPVVHSQGNAIVGDSAIHVVTVDVNGRSVPCVLYDGYKSVAIDCLPEMLP